MKTLLHNFILILLCNTLMAQSTDTLFFEDFNDWDFGSIDSIFINYDEDNIGDYNGLPGDWFIGNLANNGEDSLEYCALSSSWLVNFNPGNRNHLCLPGIYIGDPNATLSWRSSPALGNLYMDGYSVLVSEDPDFYYYVPNSGCDTLIHYAQNINDNENQFSYGVRHGSFDSLSPMNLIGVLQYPGKLVSNSISLAAYSGKTIYVSFLHNSDDDNFIAIDDILVMGNSSIGVNIDEELIDDFSIYPNPSSDFVNVEFNFNNNQTTIIELYNSLGLLLESYKTGCLQNDNSLKINTKDLETGAYFIKAQNNQRIVTKKFIKK